jgi:molybdate transport system substrate-binding protein
MHVNVTHLNKKRREVNMERTLVSGGCVLLSLVAVVMTLIGSTVACHRTGRISLTVSVAASLQDAITEIEATYQQTQEHVDFRNNFGGSGTLARQIEDGAPADLFLSASARPVDDLVAKGLVVAGTRHDLLQNSLVLIAPLDSKLSGFQGLAANSIRLIAMGDPSSVPAGRYGRQTLAALNLLNRVQKKLVLAKDVRQVLTYVETGNADAGLVYATDAETSARVRVIATAPESAHEPIVYPVVVIKGSRDEAAARRFAYYLESSAAKAIFRKRGFTIAAE